MTVTTKYGIVASGSPVRRVMRQLVGPQVRKLKGLLDRRPTLETPYVPRRASFSRADAARSLAESCRKLRRDYIDYYLLHEPPAEILEKGEIFDFLDAAKRSGLIMQYGFAGDLNLRAGGLPAAFRQGVAQYNWQFGDAAGPQPESLFLYRVAGSRERPPLDGVLDSRPAGVELSRRLGIDLSNYAVVRRLMIRAAAATFPRATLLVSSTKSEHLVQSIVAAGDALMDPAIAEIRRFIEARSAPG